MAALARAGAIEGVWLRADTQTGGRGRQGRVWQSPPGNLYASTLVRTRIGDPAPATLALVAAVALDQLVAAHVGASRAMLKWPNDLLVNAAKLSGILLERSDDAVVVGFGVNLAHHPDDLDRPVTSLAAAGVAAPDPAAFAADLADAFAFWLARWRGEGLGVIRDRWLLRAHPPGTALSVHQADGVIDGLFERLDGDGALILRLADGTTRIIHAGDVFLL